MLLGMNSIFDDFKGWNVFEYLWGAVAICSMFGLSLYWEDTPLAIASSLANILCVLLVAKGKMSNYFWGLIGVVTYGIIAYQSKYYGDTMLNVGYYLPMQFIGYYLWKNMSEKADEHLFKFMTTSQRMKMLVIVVGCVYGYMEILRYLGGRLPWLDATSTVLSVIAMLLMAKGYAEQWVLWIFVNTVSILMWLDVFIKEGGGVATLIMWSVFLINSIFGLVNWWKLAKK